MDGEDSVDVDVDVEMDPRELQETLQTYRKLADDFANHDTILKVNASTRRNLEMYLTQGTSVENLAKRATNFVAAECQ